MFIDKYRKPDGTYENKDGCPFPDAVIFIQSEIIGHCQCGDVDESLKTIRDVLQKVRDKNYDDNGYWWTTIYMLNKYDFIEHGTSLPHCWLTNKGEELLYDLKTLFPYPVD